MQRQIREVHDFFADVIRRGQEAGVIHADRDPVAEAWIFVAGGLLATIDHRLGGLLGGDLDRVRASRRAWMHRPRLGRYETVPRTKEPRLRHPGLFLVRRGAFEAPRKRGSAAQPRPRSMRLGAPLAPRPGVRSRCKVPPL